MLHTINVHAYYGNVLIYALIDYTCQWRKHSLNTQIYTFTSSVFSY